MYLTSTPVAQVVQSNIIIRTIPTSTTTKSSTIPSSSAISSSTSSTSSSFIRDSSATAAAVPYYGPQYDPSGRYLTGAAIVLFFCFAVLCLLLCLKKKCPAININLGAFRNSLYNLAAAYAAAAAVPPAAPPAVRPPVPPVPPAYQNLNQGLNAVVDLLRTIVTATDLNVQVNAADSPPRVNLETNEIIDLTSESLNATEIISNDRSSGNKSVYCI